MTPLSPFRAISAFVLMAITASSSFAQQVIEENDDPFQFPAITRKKAFQRGYWDLQQRAYPTGDIPAGSREKALGQIAQANSAPVQGNTWVSIGPAPMRDGQIAPPMPVTGRISDIAVDPRDTNRWLIGGAQGGVWETRDAGSTWTPLTDDQPSLAIGSITFAPSNPDIIYVGTGEPVFSGDAYGGAGILKSTNNGATWFQLAATNFNQNCFSDLKVHPSNANLIVAAVVRGTAGRGGSQVQTRPPRGVFRSTDGGVTWNRTLNGEATDLEIDPNDFNNQFAALGNVGGAAANGVYRSTDAGLTWTRLTGPWTTSGGVGRVELAIAPGSANTLYVSIQDALSFLTFGTILGVWRTDDALNVVPAWTALPPPGAPPNVFIRDQCWYDHDLTVDRNDPNTIYLGEVALWKYNSSGWTPVAGHYDANVQGILVHPDQQTIEWVGNRILLGNDGGLWSSIDGGQTWIGHNTTLALTQFYDGSIHPTNPNFAIAGCQDNGTSRWDGSNSWEFIWYGDGCDNAISRSRPDTDWAVSSQFLNIVRTRDGGIGRNFTPADNGIDKSGAPFIARFEKSPHNDDIFIAGTDNIWRCTNFFTAANPFWRNNGPDMSAGISALAFAPSDTTSATYAFGTEVGELRLTTNGGLNWINIDIGNKVPNRYVTDLAFDPFDASILSVTLSGFNDNTPGQPGHVFRTPNASSPNTIWNNISPPVDLPHNTLVYDPFDSAVMYVGTDIGVWKTVDAGVSWVHMGPANGMPNVAVFELQITHNPDNLVAFTHGRGAFQLRRGSTNSADLVLNFSDTPDPVTVGQTLQYRAVVFNQGPSPASDVTFVDFLPPSLTFVSALPSQGSCNLTGRRVSCNLGSLASGAIATVAISVLPNSAGQVVNSARVSSNETDPDESNNSVTLNTTVASPSADLVLTAVESADPIEAGLDLQYAIAVTNLGPSSARSIFVNSALPEGFEVVNVVSSQGGCDVSGLLVSCSVGTLQSANGATITLTVRPTVPGIVTNIISVIASVSDPNPANNSVAVVTTIKPPAPVIVAAGARLLAESVLNGGLDSNENVTVTFNLKNVGSLAAADLVATLVASNGVGSPSPRQNYGALPADGSVVGRPFSFTALPTPDGTINATLHLGDGTNDLGQISYRFALTRVVQWANLGGINIPDSGPGSVYPSPIYVSGMEGTVSKASVALIGISHTYASDIDAVVVSPAGPRVVVMSDAGGGTALNNVRLAFDDAASAPLSSSSTLVSGTFRPTDYEPGETLPSPAPVPPFSASLGAFSGLDPNGTWRLYVADDQAGDIGRIAGGWELTLQTIDPVDPNADLVLRVTDMPDPVMLGSNVTYSITVSNAGPDSAESVLLTNVFSASLSFVAASPSQGSCSNSAAGVVCALGVLTNSASATVTIIAAANTAGVGSVFSSVRADVQDTFLANNSASTTTTVSGAADLRLAIADSPDPVFINNTITYTLSVSNAGPNTAQGVALSNTLPAGVAFVSAVGTQGSGCSHSAGLVNCALGNIAAGATATVTIQGTAPGVVGTLTNRAGVRASSPVDLSSADNSATALTANSNPSFIIVAAGAFLQSETAPPTGGIEAGERVTVTFALRNTGSNDTANLVATLLPGGGITSPTAAQNYGVLPAGGAPLSRPFSFTAAQTSNGLLVATLQLSESAINLGTVTFTFPLGATVQFGAGATLNIPDNGKASVYPAPIPVGGLSGLITRVGVTISNLTHSYPDDLDILLASPTGQKTLLLSDVGGASSVTNVTLIFDDTAGQLPDSASLVNGTYRPSNFDSATDAFPSPAPASPYAEALAAFNGFNPNGTWSLYIHDDTFGDLGRIGGWSLTITTVGRVNPAPATLSSPSILPNGRFSFIISGEPGATYMIESSTDLSTWSPVTSVTLSGSSAAFDEPRTADRRFYRVLRQL